MSENLYCTHVRPDGTPCRAMALKGTGLCYWHHPDTEEERTTGLRRRSADPGPPLLAEPMRLETPEDVHQLLSFLANNVATEERPDTTRAQTLNAVAASLLRAVHVRDLRKQVTQLTADLEQERRLHADLQRELTYAREDLERYRQTLAQMRERLARPGLGHPPDTP